jgi:DNA polymerase alpha subunit A
LTKSPQEYPNPKAHPHVQVALKMQNQGKPARVGDFIPYVICEGDLPMAERAYHPDVIAKAGGALTIDYEW